MFRPSRPRRLVDDPGLGEQVVRGHDASKCSVNGGKKGRMDGFGRDLQPTLAEVFRGTRIGNNRDLKTQLARGASR